MPKSMSCARCGRKMWQGNGTLPEGQATCHPCRRALRPRVKAPAFQPELRACKNCGSMFEADRATKVYCNPECRQSRSRTGAHHNRATVAERGYGGEHQKLRRKWKPMVDSGHVDCHAVLCVMPSRWIEPGTPWDLGHTEDRSAWTGPEHRRCNRVDGAKRSPQVGWNVGQVEKACETCGHGFVTRYRMQRYCSKACRPKRQAKAKASRPRLQTCTVCGAVHHGRRYCSAKCQAEANRTAVRLRYRRRVGIPPTAPLWTRVVS